MSKFEELCQAYANAKRESREARQLCKEFITIFVDHLGEFLECPLEIEDLRPDDQDVTHFMIVLTLYEEPQNPSQSSKERVKIDLSVEKILDNYVITVYPWMKEFKLFWNELDKFQEVYSYIFEKIKESYQRSPSSYGHGFRDFGDDEMF